MTKINGDLYVGDTGYMLNETTKSKYMGQNPDIDTLRYRSGIYGLYGCSKTPAGSIGVLEVLCYSGDWCIQRWTTINSTPHMYERAYYNGTTWSNWVQRW